MLFFRRKVVEARVDFERQSVERWGCPVMRMEVERRRRRADRARANNGRGDPLAGSDNKMSPSQHCRDWLTSRHAELSCRNPFFKNRLCVDAVDSMLVTNSLKTVFGVISTQWPPLNFVLSQKERRSQNFKNRFGMEHYELIRVASFRKHATGNRTRSLRRTTLLPSIISCGGLIDSPKWAPYESLNHHLANTSGTST